MTKALSIDEFLAHALRELRAGSPAAWSPVKDAAWQDVWARIEYHGIAFLLHSNAGQLDGWPTPLHDRLAEEARLIAMWEATHHKALGPVLSELAKAGIEAVVMKGTALAYGFHKSPEIRRRGDTDLLVHPKDQTRTRAILEKLGWYRKDDPHGLYYQEGWLQDAAGFFVHSIDLHWEPSDRPVLQGILALDDFFAGKRPLPQLHEAAFRPPLALMIVHATINQKWHALHGYHSESGRLSSPRRLIWSVDFDLLCQNMEEDDWAQLEAHCKRHKVGALIAEALRGMEADLHVSAPAPTLARLEEHPLDPTLVRYFADPDSLSQIWIDIKRARSLGQKSRLIVMRAFPPRAHLVEKYPSTAHWPTALLQGRLLVEAAGRMLRKVASR